MGIIDNVTRDYLKDANVFADAFNYLLYKGDSVIKPQNLRTMSTAKLTKKNGEKELEYVERTRDLLREVIVQHSIDNGINYMILGIESQSYIDYAMPVRNLLMDAMEYTEQVDNLKLMHELREDKLEPDEFLSKIKKDDKLKLVINLVILFSDKKWDGARKLSDMLEGMDERTRRYFQDYELNIIEPAEMSDEDFERFHSNLKDVLKFIKYSGDREQMQNVLRENSSYRKLTNKAAQVINICGRLNLQIPIYN